MRELEGAEAALFFQQAFGVFMKRLGWKTMNFNFDELRQASDLKAYRDDEMRRIYMRFGSMEIEVSNVPENLNGSEDLLSQGEIAKAKGFTGDPCDICGNFSLRRNGTCLVCVDCGATTGCS
jgi:hypothetical protein